MRRLDSTSEMTSLQWRLAWVAEQMAQAGEALAWARELQGQDPSMRAEFENALREAEIIK